MHLCNLCDKRENFVLGDLFVIRVIVTCDELSGATPGSNPGLGPRGWSESVVVADLKP